MTDEVAVLRDTMSAHRSMLLGALHGNADLDLDRAFHVHARLAKLLAHWDEFTANQQRQVIRAVQYLVNIDDDVPDLTSADGFADDLAELRRLEDALGYV